SLFQDLRQRVDRFVDGGTSLDHDEHRARGLEDSREVFERVGGVKVAVLAERAHELVGALAGPVVDGDAHAVRGEVAREVHAHGREAHDPHLLLGHSPNLLGREPQERGGGGGHGNPERGRLETVKGWRVCLAARSEALVIGTVKSETGWAWRPETTSGETEHVKEATGVGLATRN